jgi:hypothetical protein
MCPDIRQKTQNRQKAQSVPFVLFVTLVVNLLAQEGEWKDALADSGCSER